MHFLRFREWSMYLIRSLSFQRGNSLLFFYLQRIPNWFTSFNEDLYSPQEDALECIEKIILFFKQLVPKGPKKELSSVGKNQDSWPYPNISRGVNHLWCCFSSHWSHVCVSKNSLLLRKCSSLEGKTNKFQNGWRVYIKQLLACKRKLHLVRQLLFKNQIKFSLLGPVCTL